MMRGSQHVKRPKGGGGDGISQVVGSSQEPQEPWWCGRALSATGSVCEGSLVIQPICCNGELHNTAVMDMMMLTA